MTFDFIRLGNGMRIIGEPIGAFKSVSVGLWVQSGSLYETESENGISHFIEHMLFKGTNKRTARDIAAEMDSVGGLLNAFTEKECTCFYTKVVDEKLPLAMDMIAELVLNSRLDTDDIKREKGVVLEEIDMAEDTPDDLVFDLSSRAHYGDQQAALPVLGTKETLTAFTREDICAYIKRMYRPECTVLAVAGSYVWSEVVEMAEQFYGGWQTQGQAPEAVIQPPVYRVVSKKKDIEQTHICLTWDGPNCEDPEFYAASLINTVFGGSMSSRLFQSIREERGLAYSVYSGLSSIGTSGSLYVYAATSPESVNECVQLINDETAKFADGISREEFTRARDQLIAQLVLSQESTSAHMQALGRRLLLTGKTRYFEELLAGIKAVEFEEANALIKQIFSGRRSAALVGPQTDIPSEVLLRGQA